MPIEINSKSNPLRTPWNKGRLVGQKRPLRPKEVWAIRVLLQIRNCKRYLAMFNLAIDSKLRGCDLVSLRVDDIAVGGHVRDRATIVQRKTGRPVEFEITEQTRASLQDWLNARPAESGLSRFKIGEGYKVMSGLPHLFFCSVAGCSSTADGYGRRVCANSGH
jgi:integrase